MWEGYFPGVKEFWEKNSVPVLHVHCSGHAYIDDLRRFAMAMKPRQIIPIHTFFPEEYSKHLGAGVMLAKDGDTIEI